MLESKAIQKKIV